MKPIPAARLSTVGGMGGEPIMPLDLTTFADVGLDHALLDFLLFEHRSIRRPALERLWTYYRNPLSAPDAAGGSTAPPAQQVGLPERLREQPEDENVDPHEVVIENDIAWRMHTLVDFMFPAAPRINSLAADTALRPIIERVIHRVFDASGGIGLWHDAALLGSIFGSVDILLHDRTPTLRGDVADRAADAIALEIIEAPRAVPMLDAANYRTINAFIIAYEQPVNEPVADTWLARAARLVLGKSWSVAPSRRSTLDIIEIHSAHAMQRYENGDLVAERLNRLGVVPVVHIQNLSLPYHYDGFSDVEPLIPLQDELNTRLSDRANRVTMQSFRMWLAKGIDNPTEQPIGPGKIWYTDNPDASIESFGGDLDSPSERQHIEELREALDKTSGVTPAAAGHIKAKVGNLSSENALRISLMGTIAKIKRKRITYGDGIQRLCSLILQALDVHGILHTTPADRRIEIAWHDPLPPDETRRLNDALLKVQLGVPPEVLRAELGYPDAAHYSPATQPRAIAGSPDLAA